MQGSSEVRTPGSPTCLTSEYNRPTTSAAGFLPCCCSFPLFPLLSKSHWRCLMSAQTTNLLRSVSNAAWSFARNINSILPAGNLPQPSWAPAPLPKSSERVPMKMGVPRRTLSLCPECNREAVEATVSGDSSLADFRDRPGIVDAEILEEAGRIFERRQP